MRPGDEITTSLEFRKDGGWQRVGKEIRYCVRSGRSGGANANTPSPRQEAGGVP